MQPGVDLPIVLDLAHIDDVIEEPLDIGVLEFNTTEDFALVFMGFGPKAAWGEPLRPDRKN